MRRGLKFFVLLLIVILAGCNSDEAELVESTPEVTADTVVIEVADTVAPVVHESPPQDTTIISFPDSAFFQAANYNGLPYQIMFPRSYDSSKRYPIVIFLHGIDERGTDNVKQLRWGASLFMSDSVSRKYPAFVVFPQCPLSNRWLDLPMLQRLKGLIDNLLKNTAVDPSRIYIEGLSMGAVGTYAMVAEYPDLFAAAIAISGYGDETKAPQMAKIDWKIYGGSKDTVVPAEKSEKMAEALRRSGASVSLKIYPNATHVDTWVNAFAEPDYCSWVFSKYRDN
jgi:predicted peptidase